IKTKLEDAQEGVKKQSWFSWGGEQLANLTTVYPWVKMHVSGTSWLDLPGHAQDEARTQLLHLPTNQEFKTKFDSIYDSLPPGMRAQFANNMLGLSKSELFMQDIFPIIQPGLEVSAIAGLAG